MPSLVPHQATSPDLPRAAKHAQASAQVVDDERQLLLAQALLWLLWLLSSAPAPSDPGPTYTQSPM